MSWHVHRDGEPSGPHEEAAVRAWLDGGVIHAGTLVWRQGMADWMQLGQVPELVAMLPGEAPVPLSPPSLSESLRDASYTSSTNIEWTPAASEQAPRDVQLPPGFRTDLLPAGAILLLAERRRQRGDSEGASAVIERALAGRDIDEASRDRLRLLRASLRDEKADLTEADLDGIDTEHLPADERRLFAHLARRVGEEMSRGGKRNEARRMLQVALAAQGTLPRTAEALSAEPRISMLVTVESVPQAAQEALDHWRANPADAERLQLAASVELRHAFALEAEGAPATDCKESWERVAALWAIPQISERFWEQFGGLRAAVYGSSVDAQKFQQARESLDRTLTRELDRLRQRYRDANKHPEERRVAEVVHHYRSEIDAAKKIRNLGTFPGMIALPVPCGPLGLEVLGLRQEARHALEDIANAHDAPPEARDLVKRLGHLGTGWTLLESGSVVEARHFAESVLEKDPHDREALDLLCGVSGRQVDEKLAGKNVAGAIVVLEEWLARDDIPHGLFEPVRKVVDELLKDKGFREAASLVGRLRARQEHEALRRMHADVLARHADDAFVRKDWDEMLPLAAESYRLDHLVHRVDVLLFNAAMQASENVVTAELAAARSGNVDLVIATCLMRLGIKVKDPYTAERHLTEAKGFCLDWPELQRIIRQNLGFVYHEIAVRISHEQPISSYGGNYQYSLQRTRMIDYLRKAVAHGNEKAAQDLRKMDPLHGLY